MANIKLNNNEYTIPDSVFAAAKADFIAHLGTIAGNGLKVVIGGVEYSVDAAKVAGAVAGLEGAFSELEPVVLALAPGLYQPGAIALWQEGNYEAASAMLKTSWDDLEANGIIAISKGVEIPEDYVMNEYGFYFGKPYSVTMEGGTARLTFNEDGSVVLNDGGEITEIPAGTAIYTDHSIDMTAMNMPVFVVSDDGTVIEGDGFTFSLEILDLPEMNEYGFYFGVFYSMTMEDMTVGLTFNEDGSATITHGVQTQPFPAGSVIYGDHFIDMSAVDMPVLAVSPDGTMIDLNGMILSVGSSSVPPKGTIYLPNRILIEGDLVFPDDGRVTSLPMDVFAEQTSLSGAKLPNSVTNIGDGAFYNCSTLTSVAIPDSVTSIGADAFEFCSSLTSVVIPDSVTYIGGFAFRGCDGLTSVVIGNNVTSIETYAFQGCSSLTNIVIPDSVTFIGQYAFGACDGLTSIVIPDSVTSIDAAAFSSCSGLASVVIGNNVTFIETHTFQGCSSLTSVVIPDSVTYIGYGAFSECSSLTSVVIPDSVTSIGAYAFYDCSDLINITFEGTMVQWNAITKRDYWKYNVPATYVQCTDGQVTL